MKAIHRIFKEGVAIERVILPRATINQAQEIRDNLLDDIECNKIIIDLSACNYIDSTFFGAMLFAFRVLRHQECAIAIVLGRTFLSKGFLYDEIASVFKVCHSMAEAMKALNANCDKDNSVGFKNLFEQNGPVKIVQLDLQLNPE